MKNTKFLVPFLYISLAIGWLIIFLTALSNLVIE